MKIINPAITILLLLAFTVASLFFLMIGLNGFSGDTGGTMLLLSGIAAFGVSVAAGASSFYAAKYLTRRFSWNEILAHAISVLVLTILGMIFILTVYLLIIFIFAEVLGRR